MASAWVVTARIGGGDGFVADRSIGVGASCWTSDVSEAERFESRAAADDFIARHFTVGAVTGRLNIRAAIVAAVGVE